MPKKDYSPFISEKALDALYAIEGHLGYEEAPKKANGTKDVPTTHYGITASAYDKLRRLKRNYNVTVPKDLLQTPLNKLSKEQSRDIAGYVAMYNSMHYDNLIAQKDPDLTQCKFSMLPPNIRDAVLLLAHRGDSTWIDSYLKNPKNPTGTLSNFKTGNREAIMTALLSKVDGKLMDDPKLGNPNRGGINRTLASVQYAYNPDHKMFKDKNSVWAQYEKWATIDGLVASKAALMQNIRYGNMAKENDDTLMKQDAYAFDNQMPQPAAKIDIKQSKENEKPGMLANLTNPIKKLFTNSEEKQNAA